MIQMLEMALLDGMDKEFELIQPCPLKALVDSLAMLPVKSGNAKLLDYSKCLLQGTDLCRIILLPLLSTVGLLILFFGSLL